MKQVIVSVTQESDAATLYVVDEKSGEAVSEHPLSPAGASQVVVKFDKGQYLTVE